MTQDLRVSLDSAGHVRGTDKASRLGRYHTQAEECQNDTPPPAGSGGEHPNPSDADRPEIAPELAELIPPVTVAVAEDPVFAAVLRHPRFASLVAAARQAASDAAGGGVLDPRAPVARRAEVLAIMATEAAADEDLSVPLEDAWEDSTGELASILDSLPGARDSLLDHFQDIEELAWAVYVVAFLAAATRQPGPGGDLPADVASDDLTGAAADLVSTLPCRGLRAPLRERARHRAVPPGSLVVLPLDGAIPHTLALHLPDGTGFMFALQVLADPDEDDLCDSERLWSWRDADDQEVLVLARDLDWFGVVELLGLTSTKLPPRPGERVVTCCNHTLPVREGVFCPSCQGRVLAWASDIDEVAAQHVLDAAPFVVPGYVPETERRTPTGFFLHLYLQDGEAERRAATFEVVTKDSLHVTWHVPPADRDQRSAIVAQVDLLLQEGFDAGGGR